jgi:hypothetical protein
MAENIKEQNTRTSAGTSTHRGAGSITHSAANNSLQEVVFPSVKSRIKFYDSSCKLSKTVELADSFLCSVFDNKAVEVSSKIISSKIKAS